MSTTTATTNIVGRGNQGGGGAVPGLVCRNPTPPRPTAGRRPTCS